IGYLVKGDGINFLALNNVLVLTGGPGKRLVNLDVLACSRFPVLDKLGVDRRKGFARHVKRGVQQRNLGNGCTAQQRGQQQGRAHYSLQFSGVPHSSLTQPSRRGIHVQSRAIYISTAWIDQIMSREKGI